MRPTLRSLLLLLLVLPSPLAAAGHGRETDRSQRTIPQAEPGALTAPLRTTTPPPAITGPTASGGRYTTLQGFYDYQSNTGPNRYTVVDSLTGTIHVTYMLSDDSANVDPSRRTGYAWTTNEGLTWNCGSTRVPNIRSGYPSLDLLTDMVPFSPLIANHNLGAGGANRSWAYLGDTTCFFTELQPVPSVNDPEPIWPMLAGLPSGGVIVHASLNDPEALNWHKNFLFRSPDLINWTSTVVPVLDGSGGRYDIWADRHSGHVATTVNGDSTILWESANEGATWGPVQVVHLPQRITGTPPETLAVWSGPDGIFYNGSPVIAINTANFDNVDTTFLFAGARIEVWRPGHGFTTAVMWDSTVHPRLMVGQSNHLSLGYPSMGVSGNTIVMAYQAFLNDDATRDSLAGGRFFGEIFLVQSTNGGATWSVPVNITNTPQLDERYPSMAKWNPAGYAYFTWQEDTRAGSGVNDDGVPTSLARQVLYKADLTELFPLNDIAANTVLSPAPATVIKQGSPFTPQARFRNVGLAGQTGIPVRYELVTPGGILAHTATGTIPSLAAGEIADVLFDPVAGSVTGALQPGVYTTRAVAALGSDTNPGNDTTQSVLVLIPTVVVTTTYSEDFDQITAEGGSFGWFAVRDGEAHSPDWILGTPAKTQIAGARSGTRCWVTRLTGVHGDDEESYLGSPAFDLSALPAHVAVTFWHNFQMEEEWDGGVLQYSTDAGVTWVTADQILGSGPLLSTTTSTFWYNEDEDSSGTVFGVPMFSMTSTAYPGHHAGWIRSSTILQIGGLSDVRFRFRWSTDAATAYEGWAVDDFGLQIVPSSVTVSVEPAWNMVSRPVETAQDSVRRLFPTASQDFGFSFNPAAGYEQRWRMGLGSGYWVKFPAAASPVLSGSPVLAAAVPVAAGWNLVGSISGPVDTTLIGSEPPGLRASLWYGFSAGYAPAAQLVPGMAYWVKASEAGFFVFTNAAGSSPPDLPSIADNYNSITVRDANGAGRTLYFGDVETGGVNAAMFEMPPLPPAGVFDVRFEGEEGGALLRILDRDDAQLVLAIRDAAGPVEVTWRIAPGSSFVLADATTGRVLSPEGMQGESGLSLPRGSALLAIRGRVEAAVPLVAQLQQNHPNPFNPVTTITFTVPGEAGSTRMLQDVSLEVFDLLGRRIATLVNDARIPGVYTATFDASKLSSGTYLYRLTAGSFRETRRMMLVK